MITTIKKDGYIFYVDIEKTKKYYQTHSLCDCVGCRNFYTQVKDKFPKTNAFLNEFGIDISKPDEVLSVDTEHYIDYIQIDYTICGKIEAMGKYDIKINDNQLINIAVTDGFVSPNEQTVDYFTISVTNINLKWTKQCFKEYVNFSGAKLIQAGQKINKLKKRIFRKWVSF